MRKETSEKHKFRATAAAYSEDFTLDDLLFSGKAHELFPGFELFKGYRIDDVQRLHISHRVLHEDGTDAGVDFDVNVHYTGWFGNFPKDRMTSLIFRVKQYLQDEKNKDISEALLHVLHMFGNRKRVAI